MMRTAPDPVEAAARLRAAMAYRGLTRLEAAKILNVSPPTLSRLTGRKGDEIKALSWEELWKFADRVGLPREWFSADFDRMAEIVTDGPVFNQRATDAPLPAPQGELGRRLQADQPNSEGRPQDDSQEGPGTQTSTGG